MKTVLRSCMSLQLAPLLLPIAGKKKETATRKTAAWLLRSIRSRPRSSRRERSSE